jgi:hypothetical protein
MSTAIGINKSIRIEGEIKMQAIGSGFRLPVYVIFTSLNQTREALEKASKLAKSVQTGIEILAVQIVPFQLALDKPPVPFEFLVRRLEEMADHFPEPIRISAYLCRYPMEALKRVLKHDCPVVMGIRKRWWPTRDERLARRLRRAGYNVMLIETE